MVISWSPVLGMIGIMRQQQEFLIVTLLGFSMATHGFPAPILDQRLDPSEPNEHNDVDIRKHANGDSTLLMGQY